MTGHEIPVVKVCSAVADPAAENLIEIAAILRGRLTLYDRLGTSAGLSFSKEEVTVMMEVIESCADAIQLSTKLIETLSEQILRQESLYK